MGGMPTTPSITPAIIKCHAIAKEADQTAKQDAHVNGNLAEGNHGTTNLLWCELSHVPTTNEIFGGWVLKRSTAAEREEERSPTKAQ